LFLVKAKTVVLLQFNFMQLAVHKYGVCSVELAVHKKCISSVKSAV